MAWLTLADLQAGRRRRRHRRHRARRRTVEPPVQEARLREADRAGRLGAAVLADARLGVPDRRRPRGPDTPPRSSRRRSTRSWRRFRETGPEQAEVERARNTIETRIIQGLETLGGFGGVADRLNTLQPLPRRSRAISPKDLQRYRDVTPASVKAFAQQQLAPTARVVVHGVPGTAGSRRAGADAEGGEGAARHRRRVGQRRRGVAQGAAEGRPRREALQLPTPTSFQLPNGLTVLVNERPGLPIVSASLVVKTGSGANPADKPGLANFTAAMLDEGTATRVGAADRRRSRAARRLAEHGVDDGRDAGHRPGRCRRNFPALLDADGGRRARIPSFPGRGGRAAAREPARAAWCSSARIPSQVARQRDGGGAVRAVAPVRLHRARHRGVEQGDDARRHAGVLGAELRARTTPRSIVSGQITAAELRPLVEKAFGDWQQGTPAQPALGAPATTTRDASCSWTSRARRRRSCASPSIGVPRATPDYEAMRVMNEALGGLFSSRINLNLREQHGYTYGASSQFVFRRAAGPVPRRAPACAPTSPAPAVTEIFKEVRRMRETPLTPEELALAKDSLVRSLPAQFETSSSVTASTANIYIYDLGLDYYTKLPARLSAVTADAASRPRRRSTSCRKADRRRRRRSREDRRPSCRS